MNCTGSKKCVEHATTVSIIQPNWNVYCDRHRAKIPVDEENEYIAPFVSVGNTAGYWLDSEAGVIGCRIVNDQLDLPSMYYLREPTTLSLVQLELWYLWPALTPDRRSTDPS